MTSGKISGPCCLHGWGMSPGTVSLKIPTHQKEFDSILGVLTKGQYFDLTFDGCHFCYFATKFAPGSCCSCVHKHGTCQTKSGWPTYTMQTLADLNGCTSRQVLMLLLRRSHTAELCPTTCMPESTANNSADPRYHHVSTSMLKVCKP